MAWTERWPAGTSGGRGGQFRSMASFSPASGTEHRTMDGDRRRHSIVARSIEAAVKDATDDALRDAARDVLRQSKMQLPIGDPALDPNPAIALRDHGKVVKIAPGVYQVQYDTDYAVKQHEARFKHPRGGKRKYVEDPLKAKAATLEAEIAAKVKTRVGRATT